MLRRLFHLIRFNQYDKPFSPFMLCGECHVRWCDLVSVHGGLLGHACQMLQASFSSPPPDATVLRIITLTWRTAWPGGVSSIHCGKMPQHFLSLFAQPFNSVVQGIKSISRLGCRRFHQLPPVTNIRRRITLPPLFLSSFQSALFVLVQRLAPFCLLYRHEEEKQVAVSSGCSRPESQPLAPSQETAALGYGVANCLCETRRLVAAARLLFYWYCPRPT